ncbi:MAG: AAA family ATPase [Prosthecobacter sp.]|jgi:adenylate kinase family enzyme|nr:AAA family ATPase [Prosthecobacter sp.]
MKIAILGNSGSGKTTLARRLAAGTSAVVLDLDQVFWASGTEERPSEERIAWVQRFCAEHESWILEGCYADLVQAALPWRPELIFLDPGLEVCLSHCRQRPHEPHKYQTQEEQDANLGFLLTWVADYYQRDGLMSHRAHQELYDIYEGPKRRLTAPAQNLAEGGA